MKHLSCIVLLLLVSASIAKKHKRSGSRESSQEPRRRPTVIIGPQGLPGDPGVPGRDGRPGAKGVRGSAGSLGFPGINGAKGDHGDRGPAGVRGPLGPPGYPADIDIDNLVKGMAGFTGEDGPPGYTGIDGVPGRIGVAGPPGIPGERGGSGFPGITGESGDDGRPGLKGLPGTCDCEGQEQLPSDPLPAGRWRPVAFSGIIHEVVRPRNDYEVLTFDLLTVDIGGGLQEQTTQFTAPVKGVYMFHAVSIGNGNSAAPLELFHNRETVTASGRSDSRAAGVYPMGANNVILELEVDDVVSLKAKPRQGGFFSAVVGVLSSPSDVTFSGFLLRPNCRRPRPIGTTTAPDFIEQY